MWHVVDVRAIWVREFAAALSRDVPTLGWVPRISWAGFLRDREVERGPERGMRLREFPLQRGFARWGVSRFLDEGRRIRRRLLRAGPAAPLIVTSPHYVSLASSWPGPRVYYATDMFRFYGKRARPIERMERVICRTVDLVCPDSNRIARYMIGELEAPAERVIVLPMATRADNLLPACPNGPFPVPSDLAGLPRPIAGVIGNLGANMDWELLRDAIAGTPWLSWAFVGPTGMPVPEVAQRRARQTVMERSGRVRFVGYKPYAELRDYARALDVAILPYRKREPTYSGSSTRFYEHLAACRPMLATRGFEELLDKQPLLRLVGAAEEAVAQLERLRAAGFRDGYEELRWRASQRETWEARAAAMRTALVERLARSNGYAR